MKTAIQAAVYDSILDAVGNTPMIRLSRLFSDYPDTAIYGKMEIFNPNGSAKDRIALNMIQAAEAAGHIKPGDTLIEPSSGNTGLGIAMAARIKGYNVIITMPLKMSREKGDMLEAFGAKVVWCSTEAPPGDPENYAEVAKRLSQEIPNSYILNQFYNAHNPEAHTLTTGPEIWEQTAGKIDYFVAGIGTSGSVTGTGRFLKAKNPGVQVIAIDPEGSAYTDPTDLHGYFVEGVGYDYVPPIFDRTVVDRFYRANDQEAFDACLEFARKEAILVGGSTGLVVAGVRKLLRDIDPVGKTIVMFVHDTGLNYLSKVYNKDWMKEKGFTHE